MHCEVYAPAAPRRAWLHVSEAISGLLLSQPIRIIALEGLYPPNRLIRRSPILTCRSFEWRCLPAIITYGVLFSVSQDYPPRKGKLTTCYWAVRLVLRQCLAWLSRILIAVISGGINRNWQEAYISCRVTINRVLPAHAFIWHNKISCLHSKSTFEMFSHCLGVYRR